MPARRSPDQSRAEARRRARAIAAGREAPEPDEITAPEPGARPPNLLARFFPPAPPLPGKGDPLAGFGYRGRGQGVVSGAWLLLKHPLPWGAPGAGWGVLQIMLLLVARENLLAFAITFAQYALLIAAGWVGWWRPWLFGVAAGVFGVIFHATLAAVVTLQAGESLAVALTVLGSLSALLILYGLVGALAGFYGGYLRRRMATPAQPARKKRR
jgi:hypothetical protein